MFMEFVFDPLVRMLFVRLSKGYLVSRQLSCVLESAPFVIQHLGLVVLFLKVFAIA